MPRSIGVDLEDPKPVYRAVVLYLYSGTHNYTLKVYTDPTGEQHQYHRAETFGPYGNRGPATGQVTSAFRGYEWQKNRQRSTPQTYSVSHIKGFVEEQIPAWTPVAGTVKEL